MGWVKYCGEQLGCGCIDVVLFSVTVQAYFRVHLFVHMQEMFLIIWDNVKTTTYTVWFLLHRKFKKGPI